MLKTMKIGGVFQNIDNIVEPLKNNVFEGFLVCLVGQLRWNMERIETQHCK